jgi:hypothetical protein
VPGVEAEPDFVEVLGEDFELEECAGAFWRGVGLYDPVEFSQQYLDAFKFL